jgi:NADH:ubiquinone oxidoreductase subunit 6 (subunit J)
VSSSFINIFLIVIASLGTICSLIVVMQSNVFRSAIALSFNFLCIAVVYFAINAEFLGTVQILVYVGAVSVLMAFSVLLVKDLQTGSTSIIGVNFFVSGFISLLTFFVLLFVIFTTDWQTVDKLNEPKIKAALFEEYSLNENKDIMIVSKETPAMEIHSGVYNNSIIPIGTLLTTKYFISLQLIGLIIVSCVVGSIAITKNTIENDDEMEELL